MFDLNYRDQMLVLRRIWFLVVHGACPLTKLALHTGPRTTLQIFMHSPVLLYVLFKRICSGP